MIIIITTSTIRRDNIARVSIIIYYIVQYIIASLR